MDLNFKAEQEFRKEKQMDYSIHSSHAKGTTEEQIRRATAAEMQEYIDSAVNKPGRNAPFASGNSLLVIFYESISNYLHLLCM